MISLTQPTDDLLDLGKSLSLVGLLLGLLSLHDPENKNEKVSFLSWIRREGREAERTNGLSDSELELHVLSDGGGRVVGTGRRVLLGSEPNE